MASAVSIAYGLETPWPLEPTQNYFQLLGWAHQAGSKHACKLRVTVGDKTFSPVERIERPDIQATYPDDECARQSGFKFLSYLPFGFYHGSLEASVDDGKNWSRLKNLSFPISSHPLQGAVEPPAETSELTEPCRIEGWCFHPEFEIQSVVLQYGNVEVPCDYGLPRDDVAGRFPGQPAAPRSGFITRENIPQGRGQIKVRALTTCGRIYFLTSNLIVVLQDGWSAKPPPPSPVQDLSTAAATLPPRAEAPARDRTDKISAGERNILFVLYGDFASNSALHVAALANHLIALGYDCVAAVPGNKSTIGALPQAGFMAAEFTEVDNLHAYFKDRHGPAIVHAWTPREIVRKFCQSVVETYATKIVVHLEDNEYEIAESYLDRAYPELTSLPMAELDSIVPESVTHPLRGPAFLESAAGTTVIVETLKQHIPAQKSCHLIWPAADENLFKHHPRDEAFRTALGISDETIVLFYHGNVHASNHLEVTELYRAVQLLNQKGIPTILIRTGRDTPEFLPDGDDWIRPFLVHLGHIERARNLPPLMALADFFVQPGLPGAFNDYRFPSKLPEFFAIGRPVILPASNLGNLLKHGEDAWILPRADAAAIADAIATLHRDPALTQKLATAARRLSEQRFSWARSAQALAEYYRSIATIAEPNSTSP